MASEQQQAFCEVATSAIQSVAAFLPLLGTQQCERHIACGMERGLLYVAATPISIFGSLGIVKAGFSALWASIDWGFFHGPRHLRNAGFYPTGIIEKLMYESDTDDSIYIAENKIRNILFQFEVKKVTVNLLSRRWLCWNLALVVSTTICSAAGLLPYVGLIGQLENVPFHGTWLFPILRVAGGAIVSILVQAVVQLRLLCIIHSRLRFIHINQSLPLAPGYWDNNLRSEACLLQLQSELRNVHSVSMSRSSTTPSGPNAQTPLSNSIHLPDPRNRRPAAPHLEEIARRVPDHPEIGLFISFSSNPDVIAGRSWRNYLFSQLFFAGLFLCRIFLLGAMLGLIAGYFGCFTMVQKARPDGGPFVWLATEIVLCVVRFALWAWNPKWDDPPSPIALTKTKRNNSSNAKGSHDQGESTVTYDVGWTLDDATANDMHAVIVGINGIKPKPPGAKLAGTSFPPLPDPSSIRELVSAVSDAQAVASYLRDDLATPAHQITTLLNSAATTDAIRKALKAIARNPSIQFGSPILIYFACHSWSAGERKNSVLDSSGARGTYPVDAPTGDGPPIPTRSYRPRQEVHLVSYDFWTTKGLPYRDILDELEGIAASKGNNIFLILDACHAGELGRNSMFDGLKQGANEYGPVNDILYGYQTHVLFAACGEAQVAQETSAGGIFTRSLLNNLQTPNAGNLTYRQLMKIVQDDCKSAPESPSAAGFRRSQTPHCAGTFQNRLLFNGLLSRKGVQGSASSSIILISD